MKKIKILSVIISVLMLLSVCVFSGYADTIYQQDGYSYTDYGYNTISICGWDNRTPELMIPNKIADFYVANISDYGLRGNQGITSLDMSETTNLRRIGLYAFADCSELSGEVVFPLRITEIGQSAFENCVSLESVVIYSNIETIKRQTFYNCSFLNKVELPSSVKTIEDLAFSNCNRLREVTIPSTVTEISKSAFRNDYNLIIKCETDSYAHQYAVDNSFPYILLDGPKTGDVNGDGMVDILDSTEIQKYAAESTEFTPEQFELGDINKDGYCDVIDALLVQKYVVGEYDIPPIIYNS